MQGTNRNGNRDSFVQDNREAHSFPLKAGLMALAAAAALACLSGCASAHLGGGDFEPGQYNPSTGYPAVGGGVPWHM